jgi:hypothetical protein
MLLEGNPLEFNSMIRASIDSAKCSIILADKNVDDPFKEDQKIIMRYFALKNFLKRYSDINYRVCVQLLKPESKQHFFSIHSPSSVDQFICIDELKLLLLAKNSVCPGIITIISTIITSEKPALTAKDYLDLPDHSRWLKEYFGGMQNEIYRIPLSQKIFAGLSFSFVSQQVECS